MGSGVHPALEILHPYIAIAWLAFGVAAVGYGVRLVASQAWRPAFWFFLGGILILTPTALVITPALFRTHLGEDTKRLQDIAHMAGEDLLAERNARIDDRRALINKNRELMDLRENEARLRQALEAERSEHQRTKHAASVTEEANDQLKKRAALASSRHRRVRAAHSSKTRSSLRQSLAHAQTLLLFEQPTFPSTYLASWLDQGVATEKYSIAPNAPQLVEAHDGQFYTIELLKEPTIPFLFGSKQFVLGIDEPEFLERWRIMTRDVLIKVQKSARVKLMLRGKADAGGAIGTYPSQHESLRHIEYLPLSAGSDQKFKLSPRVATIPTMYHNDHLPLLRSAYVKSLIVRADSSAEVFVLEGDLGGLGPSDRKVSIFLYIEPLWPLP